MCSPKWMVALCVMTALSAGGCGSGSKGPQRASVHGQVTLDGKPVDGGTIQFRPAGNAPGSMAGSTIDGGSYTIDAANGPSLGTMVVEIHAPRKTGRKVPAAMAAGPGEKVDELVEAVPKQYNEQSKLEVTIAAGDNTHNFDLKSK